MRISNEVIIKLHQVIIYALTLKSLNDEASIESLHYKVFCRWIQYLCVEGRKLFDWKEKDLKERGKRGESSLNISIGNQYDECESFKTESKLLVVGSGMCFCPSLFLSNWSSFISTSTRDLFFFSNQKDWLMRFFFFGCEIQATCWQNTLARCRRRGVDNIVSSFWLGGKPTDPSSTRPLYRTLKPAIGPPAPVSVQTNSPNFID